MNTKSCKLFHHIIYVVLLSLLLAGAAKADKVTDWNLIAHTAENNISRANPFIFVDLAYMHIAMYDAVNAIDGRYTVFAVRPTNVPVGASKRKPRLSKPDIVFFAR